MTDLERLSVTADKNGISVYNVCMPSALSVCARVDSEYYIGIDKSRMESSKDEAEVFAHELGHCITDSVYSPLDPSYIRKRCEARADEWAIRTVIPFYKFKKALKKGCCEIWEFADELGVSFSLAEKAMIYYSNRTK